MEDVRLVTWVVSNEEYAVEVKNVQEIIRITHITRMPFSRDYLPGVINLRGMVIPVVDMAKRLKFTELTISDSSRIIVINRNGNIAGLLVERVNEIVKLDMTSIQTQDILSSSESNKYIRGIGKFGKRALLILDLDEIFEINISNSS